jgi:hypothetical protein
MPDDHSSVHIHAAIGEWFIRIFALLNVFYTINVIKDAVAFIFKFTHEKREGRQLQRQMEVLNRKST